LSIKGDINKGYSLDLNLSKDFLNEAANTYRAVIQFFSFAIIPYFSLPSFPRKREPIFNNPFAVIPYFSLPSFHIFLCRHSIFSFAVIPAKAGTHFQQSLLPSFHFLLCRHSRESGNPFSQRKLFRLASSF